MSEPEQPDLTNPDPGSENPPQLPLPTGQQDAASQQDLSSPTAEGERQQAQDDAVRRVRNDPRTKRS